MGESNPVLSARLTPIRLLKDLVIHPEQTFTQLKSAGKRTCWIAAIVIVVLCTLPLIAQRLTGAGSQAALSGTPDKFSAVASSPDAMMMESEAMGASASTGPGIFAIVGVVLGTALTWLIWAGGLHLASVFLGRSNGFKQMLKLPVWAWIPYALRGILQTLYVVLTRSPVVNAGLSGFVIDKATEQLIPPGPGSLALASVLGHIDVFQLWTLLLISVGLTAFTEIPRKKALIATLIIWAALLLVSAIAAIVGGMFSQLTTMF